MMRGPGTAAGDSGPCGRRFDQCLYELMSKTDDSIGGHVAADHSVRQSRLKGLIDDAPVGGDVLLAACHEISERDFYRDAASACFQYSNQAADARTGRQLYLPDALPPVTSIAFEHSWPTWLQPERELRPEAFCGPVDVGIRTPTKMFGSIDDFLDAHFEDDIGVSADPNTPRRHFAQHRVQLDPVLSI